MPWLLLWKKSVACHFNCRKVCNSLSLDIVLWPCVVVSSLLLEDCQGKALR